jgi:glycosyltransferase involved in cell wall biosynthesis
LVVGAVLNNKWKGGEHYVAKTLINGLRERGHKVFTEGIIRQHPILHNLGGYIDTFYVNYYKNIIHRINPDVILSFFDYDCSIHAAAFDTQKPVITSIHIWWPLCPVMTLYSKKIGVCDGPGILKCLFCQLSENSRLRSKPVSSAYSVRWNLRFRHAITLLEKSDAIIVPGLHMKHRLEMYGLKNVHVINNGIDFREYESFSNVNSKWKKPNIILNPSGYADKRKGFHHFMTLAKTLKLKYGESVEFIATGYEGQDAIKGTKYLSRTEYLTLLAQAYLVVLPFLWEDPFPMVALEAMAMGKPVIAYASGGLREMVVNGITGVIIPKGNINALINSVQILLENPKIAIQMGKNAKELVRERFNKERMVLEYEKILLRYA